jgi:hypothetical protein
VLATRGGRVRALSGCRREGGHTGAVRGQGGACAVAGLEDGGVARGQPEAGSRVRSRMNALASVVAQGQLAGRRRVRWRAWATRRAATWSFMSGFDGELPFIMLELDDAVGLLERHRSPALEPADRPVSTGVASQLQARLTGLGAPCRPLHGSPHAGNRLPSADGPVLLDFETACLGPIEWDLAALGDDALAFVPDADREVIFTMGCGRRSSCRRCQPVPSIATRAPAFPCRGARRCHSRGCRFVLWGAGNPRSRS